MSTCFKDLVGFWRQSTPGRRISLNPKYTHQLGVIKLNGVCLCYLLSVSPVTCAAVTPGWETWVPTANVQVFITVVWLCQRSLSVTAKEQMWGSVVSGSPEVEFKGNTDRHYFRVWLVACGVAFLFLFSLRLANITTVLRCIVKSLAYSRSQVALKSEHTLWYLDYISLYFWSLLFLMLGIVDTEKKN